MEKIVVSACLLGEACRYDGKSKPNSDIIELGKKYELIPICTEVMGGLPIPRLPSERAGDRVLRVDGADVTREYKKGAEASLKIAIENKCALAILKARSPACGSNFIYDGTFTGTLTCGNGVCAELFIKNGIRVIDEEHLKEI